MQKNYELYFALHKYEKCFKKCKKSGFLSLLRKYLYVTGHAKYAQTYINKFIAPSKEDN